MPHTFDICIDESGDDGFRFETDCSRWFVLSGAVVARSRLSDLDKLVRGLKGEFYWKDKKPLHFRDLHAAKREATVSRLATCGSAFFRGISVMVHKPSLSDPETFSAKHRLYFYFTRFLLERASWLCRDSPLAHKPEFGDGRARIVFSNRNDLPYEEMQRYLKKLKTKDTRIAWESLDCSKLLTLTNGKHSGLQVADTLASAFYCAVHHREDLQCSGWAEVLKPVMYCNQRRYRGFGLKIFPRDTEKQIAQGTLAPWANALYPA